MPDGQVWDRITLTVAEYSYSAWNFISETGSACTWTHAAVQTVDLGATCTDLQSARESRA